MSHILLFIAVTLLTGTGLFQWAAQQTLHGNPIARDVCDSAAIMCMHPEWPALFAIAVTIIFIVGQRRQIRSQA